MTPKTQRETAFLAGQEFVDWQRLADAAPAMLWYINEEGLPVYYNQRWRSFAGISRDTNLQDAWPDRLHPDDIEWVMKTSGEALENRQSIRMEYRLRRHDGEYRQVLDMGEPQFDDEEKFIGYIGSTVDITEQRRDAIALRKSHEQLNRTAMEIQLLNELNDNLQVCKNIEETRKILSRFGRRLFPDSSVAICLIKESRNIVEPFVSWGDSVVITKMFSPDDCWALRRGKLHKETPCEAGTICPNGGKCTQFGYVCIPMMAYGEVIGILNVSLESVQPNVNAADLDDSSRTNRLAQICADQIALAIANLKLRETLQHQSTRDTLTQLYNRRYLMDNLEREFCRAKQEKRSVSLLMLDIDHFKRFNDTYGHEAGDLVLREFGDMLRKSCRTSDIVCRYGGEEFIVVLLNTEGTNAVKAAESIRRRTEELVVTLRGVPLGKVCVSIGVASFPNDAPTIDPLLACADHALYAAKAAGRNKVVQFLDNRKSGRSDSTKTPAAPVVGDFTESPTSPSPQTS